MTVLIGEPYGRFGTMLPVGHAVIYLDRVCVFAGHHGTWPFKRDLHIQYAFRYTMSFILVRVPRHEFSCVNFQASSPGCEEERRLRFAASGKRGEDHPRS
jgi:hypothetical protein